ncbi:MAG: hypothetical protein HY544_00645 [Candidatus Diapherotrites archaeon]|uniref:Uncharacterized protein n=1 Tax=Candidatus Iainarchaeum sp. TaxID=3101447 RepID=A0A8T3YM79_9ARCH|nr:hypothetical protein [Candidatus Diapherotrites archaeon]
MDNEPNVFRRVTQEDLKGQFKSQLPDHFFMDSSTTAASAFGREQQAFGIALGNTLVSACVYRKFSDSILIDGIISFANVSILKRFVKEFEVPPGVFLLDDLVLKGATKFEYRVIYGKGKRMVNRLKKYNLLLHSPTRQSVEVRSEWLDLARRRKRLL